MGTHCPCWSSPGPAPPVLGSWPGSSPTDLPDGDLYLHIDIDICDPTVVPDLLFPAPGGPGLDAVVDVVRRLMTTGRVVAVDLAATWHHNGPAASTQRQVMRRMRDAVTG